MYFCSVVSAFNFCFGNSLLFIALCKSSNCLLINLHTSSAVIGFKTTSATTCPVIVSLNVNLTEPCLLEKQTKQLPCTKLPSQLPSILESALPICLYPHSLAACSLCGLSIFAA